MVNTGEQNMTEQYEIPTLGDKLKELYAKHPNICFAVFAITASLVISVAATIIKGAI